MNQAPSFSRRARWAVPSGAVAAVGVVVAGSVLTSAQAAPSLQPRTPAQLISAIAASKSAPAALSGTIVSDAALGLPDLPGVGNPGSIASLLTGSHTIKVWYARPGQLRLALPVPLGETDLRVNGRQVWLWNSQRNTATRILPPAAAPVMSGKPAQVPVASSGTGHAAAKAASSSLAYQSSIAFTASPTPQQVARRLLAAVGPTTTVGVASNVMVAGRAAYQLTLAPKNPGSLIGRITIAVDGSRYFPLRVQVFARGAASPAFQIGFTSISFARPAASNFAFTPPPGARVKIARPSVGPMLGIPPGILPGARLGALPRTSWQQSIHGPQGAIACTSVRARLNGKPTGRRILPGKCARLLPIGRAQCIMRAVPLPPGSLTMNPQRAAQKGIRIAIPAHLPRSERQRVLKRQLRTLKPLSRPRAPCAGWHGAGWYGYAPGTGATFPPGVNAPRVIGSGWTAVAVLPAPSLTGQAGGLAGLLLRSATAVHGSWGRGRLLRTSLVSVLITSNGKALIGAVTPAVLYAAAAQAK